MSAPTASPTSFTKNETVYAQHFILWVLLNAGVYLADRTHLVTSAQVAEYAPFVTAAILGLAAKALRSQVAPKWKLGPTVADIAARLDAEVAALPIDKPADTVTTVSSPSPRQDVVAEDATNPAWSDSDLAVAAAVPLPA